VERVVAFDRHLLCLILLVGLGCGLRAALGDVPAKLSSPILQVSGFELRYAPAAEAHVDQLPPLADVSNSVIFLGVRQGVYVEARPGGNPPAKIKLNDNSAWSGDKFDAAAIRSIGGQVVAYFNSRGISGVYVRPDADDVNAAESAPVVLHLVIHIAIVKSVRTEPGNISWPASTDQSVARNSPVQQGVLKKNELDDYLDLLNRQANPHVDVAVSPATGPDAVSLDYLLSGDSFWRAYAQVSNTGTSETNEIMERFGVSDNSLFSLGDAFSADYTTAGFDDKIQSIDGSYAFALLGSERVRDRVYGGYDSFNSSEFGVPFVDFTGDDSYVGDEVVLNFLQTHKFFLDLAAGGRFEHYHVNDSGTDTSGTADYGIPYASIRVERNVETDSLGGEVTGLADLTSADSDARSGLGRIETTKDPVILQADGHYSFFLEPLLDPEAYESGRGTLANELYFSMNLQYAFNQRLIAEQQFVAGGLYTVRGYPESVTAGDSGVVATFEYRFHLPRALAAGPASDIFGQPFKWGPDHPYGNPDWDFIIRPFVDVGRVVSSDRQAFETDSTLVGAGVGAEITVLQNLDVRVDWGTVLQSLYNAGTNTRLVKYGSNRVSFVVTLSL
jgi:hemolysin activation/secretion protein